MQPNQQRINLLKIPELRNYLKSIDTALNNACLKGVYGLDDAHLLKQGVLNLSTAIDTLSVYQQQQIRIMQEQQNATENASNIAKEIVEKST